MFIVTDLVSLKSDFTHVLVWGDFNFSVMSVAPGTNWTKDRTVSCLWTEHSASASLEPATLRPQDKFSTTELATGHYIPSICDKFLYFVSWSPGYKVFFILNPTEHEINPAHKLASSRENLSSGGGGGGGCEQHRPRPAWASAQSDQRLCYSLCENYYM